MRTAIRSQPVRVVLLRGPIVSTSRSVNNEATPCIGLAYIAAYIKKQGYEVTIIDAIADGLNRYWPLTRFPGYICQGIPFSEIIEQVPADTDVSGFPPCSPASGRFSGS